MNLNGSRVLVTGAGGFIGSHLAEELVRTGARVRALIHYNALGLRGWLDSSELADEMEIVAGDITDRDSVKAAVRGVEAIFHLAALIAIPYSYQAPNSYLRVNIEGTLNVLQAAREEGGVRVIQTSTSEVYGTARYVPIDEAHPLQGQSPYSASKIGADKQAEAFHLSFGLPVSIVRPFNTYGPRQSARAVIPTIISQALAGQDRIRLGSVSPTRDLTFATDTARGFLAAAESEKCIGQTVNLGAGREISIGDLAHLILELTGSSARIVTDEARLRPYGSEVERLVANNTRMSALTGWQPEVGLRSGLEKTIDWLSKNQHLYRPGVYSV